MNPNDGNLEFDENGVIQFTGTALSLEDLDGMINLYGKVKTRDLNSVGIPIIKVPNGDNLIETLQLDSWEPGRGVQHDDMVEAMRMLAEIPIPVCKRCFEKDEMRKKLAKLYGGLKE